MIRIGPGKPLLVAALFALPVFLDLYRTSIAITILVFAIVAIGLSLVMGFAGQVSLAQAAFFGTGAYASALLTTTYGWNPWQAAPVAIAFTCAVAILVGLPALRVQSHYLGIVSLGLAVAFASLLTNLSATGGASGITKIPALDLPGIDFRDAYNFYYVALAVFLAVLAFALFIARTTLGRRFRAMRDDNLAAAAAGIEIPLYRLFAFLLAGLLAGVAGVVYVHFARYVSPDTFGLHVMFLLLAMVIIGGQDSIWGAAFGAALLILARDFLTGIQTYQQLIYGALIVATVVFAPQGLAGAAMALRRHYHLSWPAVPIPLPWRSGPELEVLPEADLEPAPSPAASSDRVLLRIDAVSKHFRGLAALGGVTLDVREGEIHGVIGPNGSGKTTLFNVISGIYRPTGGRVELEGRNVAGRTAYEMSRLGVARTFQNLRLFRQLTVLENVLVALDRDPVSAHVAYFAAPWVILRRERRRRAEALLLLARFGLAGLADELPGNLPYGRQRQLEIARALAAQPRVLLLDEPAAGLNAAEQEGLRETIRGIRRSGVTVIVIEHNMGLVMNVCERLTVLSQGRVIASGTPAEVSRDRHVIEAYLGQDAGDLEAV